MQVKWKSVVRDTAIICGGLSFLFVRTPVIKDSLTHKFPNASNWKCPFCDKFNPGDANFCRFCGKKQEAAKK
jgi:hypothetical protein